MLTIINLVFGLSCRVAEQLRGAIMVSMSENFIFLLTKIASPPALKNLTTTVFSSV